MTLLGVDSLLKGKIYGNESESYSSMNGSEYGWKAY
jgi:hypothetical protein